MTSAKTRAPQTFKPDQQDGDESRKKGKKRSVSEETEKKSIAQKPRMAKIMKPETVLIPTPDEAAQRAPVSGSSGLETADDLTPPVSGSRRKGFRWSSLFWSALLGLITLGMGLWIDQLIAELFTRHDWLGWFAAGLTALFVLAALAIAARELLGLTRMAKIDTIRSDAIEAVANDDIKNAKAVSRALDRLYADRPDTAGGRTALKEHDKQIIDGSNIIKLAERDLMKPLDDQARALVMGSAKRVSVVTAVSPRALIDIGFVLMENMRLIRRLADLYGGRPGTFGFWRLARNVLGHLAVTGTIAVGEGLIQQMVGHGLAARLSSRLGEGVINGILTARIGIAAIDICRPLPFSAQSRPTVRDFMTELVRFSAPDKSQD